MNAGTLKNSLLNHVFGGPSYATPATLYVGLFTTAPNVSGGPIEVTGGSYARATVVNDNTNFPVTTTGIKLNGANITFPAATANWGTVVAMGVFDASTAGNMLLFAALNPTRTVASGDPGPRFSTGELSVTLT